MVWLLALAFAVNVDASPDDVRLNSPSLADARRASLASALPANESRRVRSPNARITKLLSDGVRRSKTFADLVTRIHDTDVIVYVEQTYGLPIDVTGRLLLQTVAGGQRYLRVQVRATLNADQTIAVIAHELQHALEVAGDAGVTDDAGLTSLYRRIGHVSYGTRGFDTDAAETTGRVVRDELMS
jgi:hypothetical protein